VKAEYWDVKKLTLYSLLFAMTSVITSAFDFFLGG
jgi:hypothetical protein